MSMSNIGGSSGPTKPIPPNAEPPQQPPTTENIKGLENQFKDIEKKLTERPDDQGAKDSLAMLKNLIQKAIQAEESKPDGGDPQALNQLDDLLKKITELENKTSKPGDGMANADLAE